MSNELMTKNMAASLEKVLIHGDLTHLTEEQRLNYAKSVCKAIGINFMLRPFDYIFMKRQNKTVLYANRACTEQLRMKYKISIKIVGRERIDGLYVVTAQAITGKGKTDEAIGAVSIKGLQGEDMANALMKAESKAKRRVTLSIAGLGLLDELEAKAVAEQELRDVNEKVASQVEGAIEGTAARPEFETVNAASSELPPAEGAQPQAIEEYTLKAGKNKGSKLSDVSVKKLEQWMDWYSKNQGTVLHQDVHDDAFEIKAFLDEKKMSEEQKNG